MSDFAPNIHLGASDHSLVRLGLARFLNVLKKHRHLRPLVKDISLNDERPEASGDLLLRKIRLVPDLKHLHNLHWPVSDDVASASRSSRPALNFLSIVQDGEYSPASRTFEARFDMSALQELCVSSMPRGPSWTNVSFLAGATHSDGLRRVELSGFRLSAFRPLMSTLRRRHPYLTSLEIEPGLDYGDTLSLPTDADNPLVAFPQLRALLVRDIANPSVLLDVGHRRLQTLGVGAPERYEDDAWQYGLLFLHAFQPFVDKLCRIRRKHPGRFPALKVVRLDRDGLFLKPITAGGRAEVRDMLRQLRSVGLRVEDADGVEWRDGWFDEVELADA